MMVRFLCVLALLLSAGACNRQRNPQTVSAPVKLTTQPTLASPSAPVPLSAPDRESASDSDVIERPPVEALVPSDNERPGDAAASVIPSGTSIRVRLAQTLDTKHSRPGDRFVAYLDAPVISGDRVIVPKGTAFEGRVVEAKPSGRLKGRAYLGVRLDSFKLHGKVYPIATAADFRSSKSHKQRDLAIIGGSTGTGAAIGAVGAGIGAVVGAGVGAVVGTTSAFVTGKKNVTLPIETPLVFSLRGPVAVRG